MQSSIINSCKIPDGISNRNHIYIKVLIGLMILLQVGDGLITRQFVGKGLVGESNALLTSIINSGNFLLMKIVGAVFCCVVLWYLYQRFKTLATVTISSIIIFYGMITAWNLNVILKSVIR